MYAIRSYYADRAGIVQEGDLDRCRPQCTDVEAPADGVSGDADQDINTVSMNAVRRCRYVGATKVDEVVAARHDRNNFV